MHTVCFIRYQIDPCERAHTPRLILHEECTWRSGVPGTFAQPRRMAP